MDRLNRTHTVTKNNYLTVDGVRARYDVTKYGERYAVDLEVGGYPSIHVGTFRFDKPGKGVTIAAYAKAYAERLVREVIARSFNSAVYVQITDMPGFAEKRLGKHVMAGYKGTGGKPVYVVKAKDAIEADEVVARVEAIGTIVDGGRRFTPQVTHVTDHAHEALGGDVYMATDAETYLAAKRVEDVVDGGIPV